MAEDLCTRRQVVRSLFAGSLMMPAVFSHLLTSEAFATYFKHLSTSAADGVEGALAVHTSNRFLDLEPVVRGAAERYGFPLVCVHNRRNPRQGIYESEWVILTRNESLLKTLTPFAVALDAPPEPATLWTDHRNSFLEVLK